MLNSTGAIVAWLEAVGSHGAITPIVSTSPYNIRLANLFKALRPSGPLPVRRDSSFSARKVLAQGLGIDTGLPGSLEWNRAILGKLWLMES